MNTYQYDQKHKEWRDELEIHPDINERIARGIYSTKDYYYTGWEIAQHGMLILDYRGDIVDVNPHFCEKINYQRSELLGKNVKDLCVKADDLHRSDMINIVTLLQGMNQQTTSQCEIDSKEHKLVRCRWVANRIPADLSFPFSHSIVHVYFLGEIGYNKIIEHVANQQKKEANTLYQILDSTAAKIAVILIIILTALGGSLPEIVKALISLF